MATPTFGTNALDRERRIDMDRLRTGRLARLRAKLERPSWELYSRSTSPTSAT